MNPVLVRTGDGSHTIYVSGIDEHYHSVKGAITESKHVFLKNGFMFIEKKDLTILEIGFGTGLNCLLTFLQAEKLKRKVMYIAIEKHPLNVEMIKNLNYCDFLDGSTEIFSEITDSPWEKLYQMSDYFSLGKYHYDLVKDFIPDRYLFDLIYFDAFAPSKQPEMWTSEIFRQISEVTLPGGILVTYSSKGDVRRTLISAGFRIEKLPGPPGKREILRGIKNS